LLGFILHPSSFILQIMVRLKDIAARACRSIMTLSKALRGARDVSPTTRARVKQLAEQMGYVPNSAAQGLVTRTTRLLGVVISSITNPILTRVVHAIEEHAHESGYDLIVAHTANNTEREEVSIRRLLSRRVDGMFLSPVYRIEPEARVYQELRARGTPVVLLGHPAPFCAGFPGVSVDDLIAGYALTKHLLGLGHQRIAFLSGRLVSPWAQERLEGYRRALREAGRPVDPTLIRHADFREPGGFEAMRSLLDAHPAPDAVFVANNLMAVGALECLAAEGMRVPEDIGIVCFDVIPWADLVRPSLTTVVQPTYELGRTAALLLLDRISSPTRAPSLVTLPTELRVRDSSVPRP